jgi:hypothetical protein
MKGGRLVKLAPILINYKNNEILLVYSDDRTNLMPGFGRGNDRKSH